MNKILFVNSCVRENSRTYDMAKCVLEMLNGDVCEVRLNDENISPLNNEILEKRDRLINKGDFSDPMFKYAKDFANANIIVVAAPYWDLSFPSILKTYFEAVTVQNITFKYSDGVPCGLCKCKQLIYATSAGGQIYLNMGFDYVKALAQNLYGINDVIFFKSENLDIYGSDVEGIVEKSKNEIRNYFSKKINKN